MQLKRALVAAAVTLVGCDLQVAPGASCDPDYDCPPQPTCSPTETYACDGETLWTTVSGCGEDGVSSVDCAAGGGVCVVRESGGCEPACKTDADCTDGWLCVPLPGADAKKSSCVPPLLRGQDCTDAPTACGKGLVCGSDKTCRSDCTTTAPRCAQGASMACVGTTPTTCDECGLATEAGADCASSEGGNGTDCVVAQGQAFCALATTPDTRCASADSYCDADVAVQCHLGYATWRMDCASVRAQCADDGWGARCK